MKPAESMRAHDEQVGLQGRGAIHDQLCGAAFLGQGPRIECRRAGLLNRTAEFGDDVVARARVGHGAGVTGRYGLNGLVERGRHMKNRQLCLVPRGEGSRVSQRAGRRVRKVDRAQDVSECDHRPTPSLAPLFRACPTPHRPRVPLRGATRASEPHDPLRRATITPIDPVYVPSKNGSIHECVEHPYTDVFA